MRSIRLPEVRHKVPVGQGGEDELLRVFLKDIFHQFVIITFHQFFACYDMEKRQQNRPKHSPPSHFEPIKGLIITQTTLVEGLSVI